MSTRGMVGIVINGNEKFWYNHYDSYPTGLGADILSELRDHMTNSALFRVRAEKLHVYGHADVIPPELARRMEDHGGSITHVLETGAIQDSSEFAKDSLFCEWAYVVDLDFDTFEVYRGFQTEPPTSGRWVNDGTMKDSASGTQYYPVERVAVWALDKLPSDLEFNDTEWYDGEEDDE